MPNQPQNGRNVAVPEENRPSWRPQDTGSGRRHNFDAQYSQPRFQDDDRDGGGQSGYSSGRHSDDRSMDFQSRHQSYGGAYNYGNDDRSRGDDDRWTSRGGSSQQGGQGGFGEHERYSQRWETQGDRDNGFQDRDRQLTNQDRFSNQDRFGNRSWQGGWQGNSEQGHGTQSWQRNQQAGGGNYGTRPQQGNPWSADQNQNRVSHRGKGPAGYQRSDERIKEHVSEALADHEDIDATHITVEVKDGTVTLSGTVDDRQTKRMAEDVIEQLSGVKDVENKLRVGTNAGAQSQQAGTKVQTFDDAKKPRA